jgi:hypothetical protein
VERLIQNSKFKIKNSKFKIQNSKFKIQNSKFKIQNSKFKTENLKLFHPLVTAAASIPTVPEISTIAATG